MNFLSRKLEKAKERTALHVNHTMIVSNAKAKFPAKQDPLKFVLLVLILVVADRLVPLPDQMSCWIKCILCVRNFAKL